MQICPVIKKKQLDLYPLQKNTYFSPAILRPFGLWPKAPNILFQFGLKFYPDPLRFAGVIREKPTLSK